MRAAKHRDHLLVLPAAMCFVAFARLWNAVAGGRWQAGRRIVLQGVATRRTGDGLTIAAAGQILEIATGGRQPLDHCGATHAKLTPCYAGKGDVR